MKVHRTAWIKTGLGWRYIDNRRLTVLYQTSVQQQSSCPILIREMNRGGKPSYTTRNRQTEVSNRPFAKVPAFTTPCPGTDIPETLARANAWLFRVLVVLAGSIVQMVYCLNSRFISHWTFFSTLKFAFWLCVFIARLRRNILNKVFEQSQDAQMWHRYYHEVTDGELRRILSVAFYCRIS